MTTTHHTSLESKYEKLFREYYSSLCYFAQKYITDLDSCKEIVHTVFVAVWEKRDNFDFDKPAKSYLFTSVYNRCMNYLRDRKKFAETLPDNSFSVENSTAINHDNVEAAELENHIWAGIRKLPDKCREIFELNRFEGKRYAEIADMLSISVKTVEAQMSKALKMMREHLIHYIQIVLIILMKNLW